MMEFVGKKTFFMIIAIAMFMTIFLSPLSIYDNSQVDASTITSLTKEKEKIEKELAALKKEKSALSNQSSELKGELSWLNARTAKERKQYEDLVDELNSAYLEMEEALRQAEEAENNVDTKQEEYKLRLQAMFENRNKGTLEMLFDARDLSAFLANVQIISIIAENDKKVLNELNAAKDEAFLKRTAAEEYSAEMEIFVEKKNKEIKALRNNIALTEKEIKTVAAELSEAEKQEKSLMAESNKIANQITKLQSSGGYYGGAMLWPTPGYTRISPTNVFGMRLHPIYKYWRMHNGIDIASPMDSKMVSVADGRVIVYQTIPGYNSVSGNNFGGSGYGNYIIIDHGGGISTVYAHCKLLKVRLGENVKGGQWIATTGSTGLSTGAHLHFEVRESGIPVNPLQKKYLGVK